MRNLVLVLASIAAVLGLAATARLAAVVSITPQSLWLVEAPPLIDLSIPVTQATQRRADAMVEVIDDPALIRARLGGCKLDSDLFDNDRCISRIDDALRANPVSGELWLFKAMITARTDGIDDEVIGALRNAYATAPKEGWLAADRVVFTLRVYPLLPEDLKNLTVADLQLVLASDVLAAPLVAAYASDFTLRDSASGALEALPPATVARFVDMVNAFRATG